MTTTTGDLVAVAVEIAAHLGEGWFAMPHEHHAVGADGRGHYTLRGPGGEQLDLWWPADTQWHRKGDVGRIHVEGQPTGSDATGDNLHPYWCGYREDRGLRDTITVDEAKPASAIAHDITLRLLPDYRVWLDRARARHAAYAAHAEERDRIGRAIAAEIGGEYHGAGTTKEYGRNEAHRRYVTGALNAQIQDNGLVRIEATVTPGLAVCIAELIAAWPGDVEGDAGC